MPFRLANVAGRAALVDSTDRYHDIEQLSSGVVPADPMQAMTMPDSLAELATGIDDLEATGRLADAVLGSPSPRPRNSFGVGLNYQSHVAESTMEVQDVPIVFTKFPSCIVGPNSDILMRSDRCDYEGELVIVIGSGGKDIPAESAWDHVLGLAVGQDFSDRGAQFMNTPPQFNLGKSMDTFGPMGPVVASPDSFENPDDLGLQTWINGELRQQDRTSSFIFDVSAMVAFLSRFTTLRAGDVVFTGTPEGIGHSQGKYLRDGDVITTTIEGIGTLTNRCVRVSDYS